MADRGERRLWLYRSAIALALAAGGRGQAPGWLYHSTHNRCRKAIDHAGDALCTGRGVWQVAALQSVGKALGWVGESRDRPMRLDWPLPAVAQLPRAQAALREQLELSERPDDEQAGDGSVLESLLVVLWPRRRTWSELLYWSAVALALAAWGRDDPALGAPIRAAIEAAGEALGARGSARLHAAESQVSQALAEAVVSTPRGTYRASEDAGETNRPVIVRRLAPLDTTAQAQPAPAAEVQAAVRLRVVSPQRGRAGGLRACPGELHPPPDPAAFAAHPSGPPGESVGRRLHGPLRVSPWRRDPRPDAAGPASITRVRIQERNEALRRPKGGEKKGLPIEYV